MEHLPECQAQSLSEQLFWIEFGGGECEASTLAACSAGLFRRPRPLCGYDPATHERQVLFPKNEGATRLYVCAGHGFKT